MRQKKLINKNKILIFLKKFHNVNNRISKLDNKKYNFKIISRK